MVLSRCHIKTEQACTDFGIVKAKKRGYVHNYAFMHTNIPHKTARKTKGQTAFIHEITKIFYFMHKGVLKFN